MKQGTQIAYVPLHANGDLSHPDVQFGFVVSERADAHFCRYWITGVFGQELRTLANSELTPTKLLVERESTSQRNVEKWLTSLGYIGQTNTDLQPTEEHGG